MLNDNVFLKSASNIIGGVKGKGNTRVFYFTIENFRVTS